MREQTMRQLFLEGRALHIFPCRADKTPACEHWFDDAVPDQAGIDRLWSAVWPRNRPALVGVPTGVISGIAVIDIDPRRGGDKWFFENRDRLPKTRTHETQSFGQHLIYRNLPGLRCSKDRIAPGVRGEGRWRLHHLVVRARVQSAVRGTGRAISRMVGGGPGYSRGCVNEEWKTGGCNINSRGRTQAASSRSLSPSP